MAISSSNAATVESKRGIQEILKSYFYWTYSRGSFHYDVMVTLILLFIFITPHLWNYGARPSLVAGPVHPLEVVGAGRDLIVTVQASDIQLPAGASYGQVKNVLRQAIEPVTGDAVFVEKWETGTDAEGNRVWKVWAHR